MTQAIAVDETTTQFPQDESRHWYDLFRLDQTTVLALFFLIVAGLLLVLLVPQINRADTLVRHQQETFPQLPAYAMDWPQAGWAFQLTHDTSISTLTLGIDPPAPPDPVDAWRFWDNDWAYRMLNPVALRVPVVSFMLVVLVLYLVSGLLVLLPRRIPSLRHLLPIYVAIVAAVVIIPVAVIGALNNFVVPIVAACILGLIIYLVGLYSGRTSEEGMARAQISLLMIAGAFIIPAVLVLVAANKSTSVVTLVASSVRLATPIVIGAMAGIWCERSGVVNIAIEGMMLTGAAFGFFAYTLIEEAYPGSGGIWIGIVVATISGGLMSLLHAWLSITFRTDQIISGTVINILALGLTSFLRRELLANADASRPTLPSFQIPVLGNIPIVGEIFFTGKPVFFSMFFLVALTHIMLFYTRWGLRTRAVGENPHAADTLGINVIRNRYFNVVMGGLIAGLAGAWFSLETAATFDEGMTNGLGFIALAAVIFGKWRPLPAVAGGLLFGFSRALDTRFQILDVGVPVQFVQMTPYIVTMVVLAGLVGRAIPPKADGQPYTKE